MSAKNPRVLILSHRDIVNHTLARCLWFEFEDIIKQIDAVEMLCPGRSKNMKRFDRGFRIASKVGQYLPVALNPGVHAIDTENTYELFFTLCAFPTDLLYLSAVKSWRKKCKTAVCWIDEMLLADLPNVKYLRTILPNFDHVVVSCNQAVDVIQELIRGKCVFAAPAVDTLLFCPYPDPPARFIDVLSIGRRPDTLHNRLINAVEAKRLTYVYDTIDAACAKYGLTTTNTKQHRLMLSQYAKRANCFVVYPGKFDQLHKIGQEEIIGARYFEGAAAGALLIGKPPRHEDFAKLFFWPNAVKELDLASDDVERDIRDIIADPECETQRRNNIVYSLLYHDWVYRWETVLALAGLEPLPQFFYRKRRLQELSTVATTETAKALLDNS